MPRKKGKKKGKKKVPVYKNKKVKTRQYHKHGKSGHAHRHTGKAHNNGKGF